MVYLYQSSNRLYIGCQVIDGLYTGSHGCTCNGLYTSYKGSVGSYSGVRAAMY